MLFSRTRFESAGVLFGMHVAIERSFSIIAIHRRGLFYDGAVAPCCKAPSRGRVAFHVLLEGSLATSNGLHSDRPVILRMAEDVLEGANGTRPATLRTWGEPHVLVAVHIDRALVVGPAQDEPQLVAITRAIEAAARYYATAAADRDGDIATAARALLHEFVAAELLAPSVASLPLAASPEARLWSALSTFIGKMDTAPTLTALTDLASISPRHADRLLRRFTDAYGLPAEGWRDLTRRWRLKLATVLLSSPALTVVAVARRVGYRNAEALANAMAQDGLLPPSHYRTRGPDTVSSPE
jgi:methylphosphotriester-DNA--protein-cysteine methyltransferase